MANLITSHKVGDSGHATDHNEIASRLQTLVDLGIDNTGISDCSSAIIAIIESGKDIVFPAGTFLINSTIFYKNQTRITGAGRGKTILVFAGTGFAFDAKDQTSSYSFVEFSNFTLKSLAYDEQRCGINLHGCINSSANNIEIQNMLYGACFTCDNGSIGCWWNYIDGCKFDNCLESIKYTGSYVTNANTVSNCNIHMLDNQNAIGINIASSEDDTDTARIINVQVEGRSVDYGIGILIDAYGCCVIGSRFEKMNYGVSITTRGVDSMLIANTYAWTNIPVFSEINYYIEISKNSKERSFIRAGLLSIGTEKGFPPASSQYRGKIILVPGGTGVADGLYICIKQADESYLWAKL